VRGVRPALRFTPDVRLHDVEVGASPVRVAVASLRTSAGLGGAGRLRWCGASVATPVAVGYGETWTRVPWTAHGAAGMVAAMMTRRAAGVGGKGEEEEDSMGALERLGSVVRDASRGDAVVAALSSAASGQGVVGPVTSVGDRSVIPLIETYFAGGYGGGGGAGEGGGGETEDVGSGGGGGGGGVGRSRTVAVVEVTPQGVTVRPVVDATKLALAVISGAVGLLVGARRRRL
jgi:uncharacterized spore protein YtfJ